ncbi:hypothetical protein Aci011_157 [Acinetobacter phage vB_AbaM_B09_Aci01-1]|uniref:Uncharacterized protein n=1 Tax=Acinetobacter phage vB_AbaM_B09_Aci01-1 TaxID=2315466 RepID=A0A386KMY4_9CAUD|nr:hypothetical protein HOU29_gp024 [Acinetobacter phage vB_AbaM_B09_Aci01-1]AYD85597.1 hypothetical protein Aci011_157 [Acinetobacter phage vB_AbaM_B09_Aci01-1]
MDLLKVNDISYLLGTMNMNLHKHIRQLPHCLKDEKFRNWYWYKFCKYNQKIDMQDLRCLVESVNNFLTEQEAKKEKSSQNIELNRNIIKQRVNVKPFFSYVFRLYDVNGDLLYRCICIDNDIFVDWWDEQEEYFFNLGKF